MRGETNARVCPDYLRVVPIRDRRLEHRPPVQPVTTDEFWGGAFVGAILSIITGLGFAWCVGVI